MFPFIPMFCPRKKGVRPMKPEQYILEITRMLHTLDSPQLAYVYTYIKGYFDINDRDFILSDAVEVESA